MSKKSIRFALLGICIVYASGAQAATYISNRTVGTASVLFSLTTDDTIGVLSAGNITNYAITILSGADTINFTPANASTFVFGSALSATATDLLFDFNGAPNSFLVFNRGAGIGDHYCFETSGCSGTFSGSESFRLGQNGSFTGEARSGLVTIASVAVESAVPEPRTWAMMLFGFGGIGLAMRRSKRRSRARVQVA